LHSADQARAAVDVAHAHSERVSIDLIYARPGQTVTAWREELREALGLGVRHLSAYQLTIEPGTAFYRLHEAGKLDTPPDDTATDVFHTTRDICDDFGLAAYEISNHAVPGDESRHNLIYWRYGDYVGVGPGAHGRLGRSDGTRVATETLRNPAAWLGQVERDGHGIDAQTMLAPLEQAEEMLLMGLRLAEGVSLPRLRALTGHDVAPAALDDLRALGLIAVAEDRVRVAEGGRLLLNQIAVELASALCPLENLSPAATA